MDSDDEDKDEKEDSTYEDDRDSNKSSYGKKKSGHTLFLQVYIIIRLQNKSTSFFQSKRWQ